MDYQLENLGPERFQLVCQSLLVSEFPGLQCFPVAQPDGGRDATAPLSLYFADPSRLAIFQIKYARKPLAIDDPQSWLLKTIAGELPKIEKLIPDGAAKYILMTNVPGTAHHNSGSIDLVQEQLDKIVPIPSQCWWRNDINRRLDNATDVKWIYPEILSTQDILRHIIENGLSDHKERRTNTIRAFMRDQFERDNEVRFKQIELQNRLLDLFIDVPISLQEKRFVSKNTINEDYAIQQVFRRLGEADGQSGPANSNETIGAATLLLQPDIQGSVSRIVLEGAPGQGKSTLVQYLCQIHRCRVLGENLDIDEIPVSHRNLPARLPFKIDLRDLALWLRKKNPFLVDSEDIRPSTWQKSVESFLAAQITHYSGGADFSVSDLHAVTKLSSILIVFDGLDEVADTREREDVVAAIISGVNRLSENAISVQAIVTSRPAAFANSPGLPPDRFRYFSLEAITRPLIESYAEKWLRARKLVGRQAADVRTILKEKLAQPHLQELSRNPMQLSIVLSLINRYGASLPEKRTSLYERYVELFISRESEKSEVVREHNELIIDLHQYLGWTLHVESQLSKTGGRVSEKALRKLVKQYLEDEQHDTSFVDELFNGMIDRVMALVSRVEGTFEFEVQPLREFFAARYLYTTAPYSPQGSDFRGTKPDRFDALVRDFYWLNVARFYAGCYDKGEIASLVDRLEDLAQEDDYKHTSHPQMLAATLLADWVFAKYPKAMKKVVALILDGIGLRSLIATVGGRWRRQDTTFVLPVKCGNSELIDRCFELLAKDPAPDFSLQLIDLLRVNSTREHLRARWLDLTENATGDARTMWLRNGMFLGVLSDTSLEKIDSLLEDSPLSPERINILVRTGNSALYQGDSAKYGASVNAVLDGIIEPTARSRPRYSSLEALSRVLNPNRYSIAITNRESCSLATLLQNYRPASFEILKDEEITYPQGQLAERVRDFVEHASTHTHRAAAEWGTSLSPWDEIIESGRRHFGDRWSLNCIAVAAAGIKSKTEKSDGYSNLLDSSKSLCKRIRFARLRVNNAKWWQAQLQATSSSEDQQLAILTLVTWASPTVILNVSEFIDGSLASFSVNDWTRLGKSLRRILHGCFFGERSQARLEVDRLPTNLSNRAVTCLGFRLESQNLRQLYNRYLVDYSGDDQLTLELCQEVALSNVLRDQKCWSQVVPVISKCYQRGVVRDISRVLGRHESTLELPLDLAKQILDGADQYPGDFVAIAENTCRRHLMKNMNTVGSVATRDNWFEDSSTKQ